MQDETSHFQKEPTPEPKAVTETQTTTTSTVVGKPKPHESQLFYMSLRGLIALIVVLTLCFMALKTIEVKEPFYTVSISVVAFYFGQASRKNPQNG